MKKDLDKYIEKSALRTFCYGKFDCAVFVDEFYGLGILERYEYSAKNADEMLNKHLADILLDEGFIHTDKPKRGNLIVFQNKSIGLCINQQWGVTVAPKGIVMLTMNKAKEIWLPPVRGLH